MHPSNPILALAERELREQLSPQQLRQETESLLEQGFSEQDLAEAFEAARDATCPTPLLDTVGQICAHIVAVAGRDKFIGSIHFSVASVLGKRDGRRRLRLAVQHYQQACQWL